MVEARQARTRGGAWRPVAALVSVCAVTAALLAVTHQATAPAAAANAERRVRETYAALAVGVVDFEEVPCDVEGCVAAVSARDRVGAEVARIVVAQAKGYGGQVPLAVAFDASGTVTGVVAMSNDETPGLGTRIAGDSYLGQYVGLSAEPVGEEDVDLISGATISSRAALAAFDVAVQAYGEVW